MLNTKAGAPNKLLNNAGKIIYKKYKEIAMPNLDGTGPNGRGSLTGRRRGHCRDDKKNQTEVADNNISNKGETVFGFGRSRGRRRGQGNSNRGMGRGFGRH